MEQSGHQSVCCDISPLIVGMYSSTA